MFLRRGSRSRATTASLLSSLFPGVGQLYNRDWGRAMVMFSLAVALLLRVKASLTRVVLAAAHAGATGPEAIPADNHDLLRQLLPLLADPTVQADIRYGVLPLSLGLCALVLWSMVDAYRSVRRDGPGEEEPEPASASSPRRASVPK
jgi:hypothetical protein